MSGIEDPGTPPEVPEEYAAVYRDAYQRALESDGDGFPWLDEAGPAAVAAEEARPLGAEERERPGWLPAVAIGAGVLVIAAFAVGRLLSDDDPAEPVGTVPTSEVSKVPASEEPAPSAKPAPTKSAAPADGNPFEGPVRAITIPAVQAGCTSSPGVDSSGEQVRYDASNAIDGDPATAWRCDGEAIGTVLTLTLPADVEVGEVGLIPGYAKTDPSSGADRYAENNRITKVRWTLADGVVVEQDLSADPSSREVQRIRVPRTATGTLTLEILAVDRGSRNTTAISEIEVAAAS